MAYIFETKLRVRYYETDKMGVVHHSNYIRYYETARTEMMIAVGFSYGTMEKEGVMMPIVSVASRYIKPAYYEDELTIRVILQSLPTATIKFEYEIYNQHGEKINTGETVLAFTNCATNRPCRPPKKLFEIFEKYVEN